MDNPRLLIARTCVWRSPGVLQVGGDGRAFALHQVPDDIAEVIPLLDGCHSITQLEQVCSPRWLSWLLTALQSHDCLAEGPVQPRWPGIDVVGEGPLARRITDLLSFTPAAVVSPAKRLRIVAPGTAEADRVAVSELMAQRLPHLLVRASDERASVGPFVIPGSTSCLTCVDLARRDLDPSWPVRVFQLARVPGRAQPSLCAWAAATAVTHVRAWASGFRPESESTTVELSGEDGRLTYRAWPVHQSCSHCHATRVNISRLVSNAPGRPEPGERPQNSLATRSHPQGRH